jgi:riboflavin kinase/FMN adenylyltransferase
MSARVELIRGLHNLRSRHHGSVVTIGNYDGVHLGHRAMLAALRRQAVEHGQATTVVTFEPNPREYLAPDSAPARLMRLREKLAALGRQGVERVLLLRFDAAMQAVPASEFVERVLVQGLGARALVVGHDFRFARRREGNVAMLREAGARRGFEVEEVDAYLLDGERVSSSLVRAALGAGDLARAGRLLGDNYRIAGRVRRGKQLGRRLGYPTANLALHRKVVPLSGIFAVRVHGTGLAGHPAVASLGTRPTVDERGEPLLEAHLFDFDGDLYGRQLEVEFLVRLREERRFESLDALVEQMHRDEAEARAALAALAGRN